MIDKWRAKVKKSKLIRNTYGRLRWYTSCKGLAQIYTKLAHFGWSVQCPFCGWHGRAFYPHPAPNERPNALCPRCKSKERHRALYYYLSQLPDLYSRSLSILEIAPGPYSRYLFRNWPDFTYCSLDIESPLAKVKGNICALSFPQKHFDLIICYHVLEHIVDDYSAIQELQRVLAVEGLMLLQVPIKGDATYEDLTVTNPFERARLFGQKDHVRFYGRDFRDRVASVGLRVEEVDFAAEASDEVIQRYGLRRGELSYICRR